MGSASLGIWGCNWGLWVLKDRGFEQGISIDGFDHSRNRAMEVCWDCTVVNVSNAPQDHVHRDTMVSEFTGPVANDGEEEGWG